MKGLGKSIHGTAIRARTSKIICMGGGELVTRREQKKMHIMEHLTCFVRRLQNLESPLAPKQFILSKISSRVKEHIYHYVIKIGFRARAPLDEN
jgi:hypothetical protein